VTGPAIRLDDDTAGHHTTSDEGASMERLLRDRRIRRTVPLLALVVAAAGCAAVDDSVWDGEPWTSTHPESCRRYEPMTDDWVRAHPANPCAQLPVTPSTSTTTRADATQLGPACRIERGGPLQCSSPAP
jgi:hypothetical protein